MTAPRWRCLNCGNVGPNGRDAEGRCRACGMMVGMDVVKTGILQEEIRWLVAQINDAESALGERLPGRARAILRRALEQAEEFSV